MKNLQDEIDYFCNSIDNMEILNNAVFCVLDELTFFLQGI